MTPGIRPLAAGNWKMNGTSESLEELRALARGLDAGRAADALLCLPATLLERAARILSESGIHTGGQDCHWNESGAHTGDISAEMLKDAGAGYVIVGHSERRTDHGETSEIVAGKARAAWRAGLVAIICIGETEQERREGRTLEILSHQIRNSVPQGATASNVAIAYEPVWAIGTGLTPKTQDVATAHAHIRRELAGITQDAGATRLLYGGSVKPSNAAELLAVDNVDGALVGGASLKAADFLAILAAFGGN